MSRNKIKGNGSSSIDFNQCVDRYDCALRDLVRHLARIAAERDCEAFHKGEKHDFMVPEQKEPKP